MKFAVMSFQEVTGMDDSRMNDPVVSTFKLSGIVVSAITNPVLYALLNERLRQRLMPLITCGRAQTRVHPDESDSGGSSNLPIPHSSGNTVWEVMSNGHPDKSTME